MVAEKIICKSILEYQIKRWRGLTKATYTIFLTGRSAFLGRVLSDSCYKLKKVWKCITLLRICFPSEIGTIIYSLGRFPSQADLHNFIAEVEEDQTGYIHLDRFLPAMTKVLMERKFPPICEEVLLQAFEVLDKEKKGFLDPDDLSQYMMEEGEAFTQEEMDEMLTALTDHETNLIYSKDLLNHLILDPEV
uniref:EF-hand calcium binding domain 2 n=1 Tax=Hippocampus comes TaxID=109280 RepID=A0A3Q3DMC3_HIPCM